MANPTTRWDFIPVYGVYLRSDDTPVLGTVKFEFAARVTRVDGRVIYPAGALVSAVIGDQAQQDATVRSVVRAAWRAADSALPGFNGTTWDTWWDTIVVPAAIFTRFPALDDPDIVQTPGAAVRIQEALTGGSGRQFNIVPSLAHLDLPVPGINLGLIEVPPDAPGVPAPMYAKGVPGGVASLDETGMVPLEQLPEDIGGGATTVEELTDATTVGKALVKAADADAARTAINAQPAGSYATAAQGAKADTAVQPAGLTKAAVGLGNVDNTSDANKPVSTAQSAAIAAAVNSLVSSSPATLDTLAEIATALGNDPNLATTITNALAVRVRADTATQGLTATQKGNARTNIDVVATREFSSLSAAQAAATAGTLPNPCLVVVKA